MNERGKIAITALSSRPAGTVQVMPPEAAGPGAGPLQGVNGHELPRFVPRPGGEGLATMADQINMWLSGDLSFMDQGPGAVVKAGGGRGGDPEQRKRNAMADALDGDGK